MLRSSIPHSSQQRPLLSSLTEGKSLDSRDIENSVQATMRSFSWRGGVRRMVTSVFWVIRPSQRQP